VPQTTIHPTNDDEQNTDFFPDPSVLRHVLAEWVVAFALMVGRLHATEREKK
jgi:hypothetical protein